MDDLSYSKSRDRSIDRHRSTSEKRSRDEHYGRNSSRDRHHHSSSSHREKRRNYGDDRTSSSRYSRHRDRSRERWPTSSNGRSSKERESRTSGSSNSRKDTRPSQPYHRRDAKSENETTTTTTTNDTTPAPQSNHQNDVPPTAPAAYYQQQPQQQQQQQTQAQQQYQQQYYQHAQLDPQQQQAAAAVAWASHYGYTVTDFNHAYGTNYTNEQYQQYIQHYYQSQDPNAYYGYYDSSYYQIPQQDTTTDAPPPPPSTTPPSSSAHTNDSYMGGVPENILLDVGYPVQKPEDPSILFEKIGQVGEGTYGKVYKARNGKTGKLMALKRIRMKTEKDGFPITAMREIKLLQKLKHERIVELQEIMIARGSIYMVLEYMDHDLSGILGHPNFNFEPAHAKSLVKQMLEGLAYLHHMGILHRDIKGSNLLINNKGELKIADFGLARVFEKNQAHDYTNRVITLWYRPPELLLGATAYGPAVDIWSVGCIMLEFFTGKAIFNGTDEVSQLDSIYKIMGTPSVDKWPTIAELPWYALVRPNENYASKFRESFETLLSPGALELSEALLSMNPANRPTAAEALEFNYFKNESPEPIMPANLLSVHGDWHEFESKQRKRQKAAAQKPPHGNSNYNNDNRTKAPPSSALSRPPPPPPPH